MTVTMTVAMTGLLALAALILCGWIYVGGPLPWPLRLALSHLVGVAALATGVTVGLALTRRASLGWGMAGLAVLLLLGVVRARTRRGSPDEPEGGGQQPSLSRNEWLLIALLAAGVLTAAARVALLPLDWDAWAFWQVKAKALADGSLHALLGDPRYQYGHADYPLLNPTDAWWLSGGGFHVKLAQVAGFLFMLDLLVVFYYAARQRMDRTWALAGCVVMLSWAGVMKHSASGFSDIPLAAYILAALTLAAGGDGWRMAPVLAGMLLTKDEGILALLPVLIAGLFSAPWKSPGVGTERPALRWRLLGSGVLAFLLSWGAWHFLNRRWGLYSMMLDPTHWTASFFAQLGERVRIIVVGFTREAFYVGPWYPAWGPLWLLMPVGAVISVRRKLWETAPLWLALAAHLAGTAGSYLITPMNPEGHLLTSIDRLALQIAPVALMATLVAFYRLQAGLPQQADDSDQG